MAQISSSGVLLVCLYAVCLSFVCLFVSLFLKNLVLGLK